MKIVIFGSYNGGSIGDTAILLGMLSAIFRIYGNKANVTVITFQNININDELKSLAVTGSVKEVNIAEIIDDSFGILANAVNKAWRAGCRFKNTPAINKIRVKAALKGANILLIGGGNLIMDLFSKWPPILGKVCELAIKYKVPYSFVGVGGSPITTDSGKQHLLFSLKEASSVYFRDSFSKEYCEKVIGFEASQVGPDLAFGIEWQCDGSSKKIDALFLNLAPVFSEHWPEKNADRYERYLHRLVEAVDLLSSRLDFEKVVIFNTNYPLDSIAVEDFLKLYENESRKQCSISYVKGRKTVSDLLSLCAFSKVALVTRLHAGIISSIAGSDVLAIEYQPKVRDVLEKQFPRAIVESFDAFLDGNSFDNISSSSIKSVPSERYVKPEDIDALLASIINSTIMSNFTKRQ